MNRLLKKIRSVELERKPALFSRHPHPSRTVLRPQLERGVEDHRMNMQVKMAVDVRKREARRAKLFELRCQFFP